MSESFVFYGIAFVSGLIGLFSSDPELRKAGVFLAVGSFVALLVHLTLDVIETRHRERAWQKYQADRIQERLNALEVWREDELVAGHLDDLRERVDDIERVSEPLEKLNQIGRYVMNIELANLWPVAVGLLISGLYFYLKKGKNCGDK